MSLAMRGCFQSVEVNGTLYVGGGLAVKKENNYIVMAFNTNSCNWRMLPPYSANRFAMATINNLLVLVGGIHHGQTVNKVGAWQAELNQWIYPFPPMLSPRKYSSATSYKHCLVVAGGFDDHNSLSTVEVLDVDTMQWSTCPSTPMPWHHMKSTKIDDTWYFLGGRCDEVALLDVYSVSLEALVFHSTSDCSLIWRKLVSLNCISSTSFGICGSLLAVGGKDKESDMSLSVIQRYIPETDHWIEAGTIPHTLNSSTCIVASDELYLMGGTDGKHCSAFVYVCNI